MRGSSAAGRWRRPPPPSRSLKHLLRIPRISTKRLLRILPILVLLAFIPPIFFHFRLRRFHQMRQRKCGWLENPPLVCAHGGDSSRAAPNTDGICIVPAPACTHHLKDDKIDAYQIALDSNVDCIEVDVSRSSDGVLFALHDRDLQRMSGNDTAKVGYMNMKEIKELDAGARLAQGFHKQKVPTLEDALVLISNSVRQVIIDAKVGPPSFEKGLARDILSVVKKAQCENCLIWAKSDTLGRDVIKLTENVMVGYIVMKDPSTGATSNLLRMKDARVVGVYHPLIDERLMRILHGRGKKVYAWTVDDADSMQKLLLDRVDAIVTGQPTLLQGLMQDIKTECRGEGFPLP